MPYAPPRHRPAYIPSVEETKRTTAKTYNRTKRKNQTFYNSQQWRRVSKSYRRRNPLCVGCFGNGINKAAQVTDHIKEIEDGGALYDEDNLQGLCISCHNTKTSETITGRAG